MRIDADDMCDVDRYHPVSDHGFREYRTLCTRVLAASNYVDVTTVCARVTNFVQNEDHNPVYCETLVNLLMVQGYKNIASAIDGVDNDTYALMASRLITRHVRATVMAWQGTMSAMENRAEG